MTRYRTLLVFLFMVFFAGTLMVNLPADRVVHVFRSRLPEGTVWQQLTGTVFDSAFTNLAVRLPNHQHLLIHAGTLQLSILPLLIGQVRIQFEFDAYNGEIRGVALLDRSGWQLKEMKGSFALQALSELHPLLRVSGTSGRVDFTGTGLSGTYAGLPVSGRMQMMFDNLKVVSLSNQHTLGDYSLSLQASTAGGIQGDVATDSTVSLLIIKGRLALEPSDRLIRFDGEASAGLDAPDAVKSLLPLLGEITNDRAHIQWRTGY